MDIDPDIGVCHPQGAVEAGHHQGQEGQTDTTYQLSPGDQGHTGQEIHLLQGGEGDRVSAGDMTCSGGHYYQVKCPDHCGGGSTMFTLHLLSPSLMSALSMCVSL